MFLEAFTALRSCPAGSAPRWGFGGAAPTANRMEDLNVEICEEARGKTAPCVSICRQASAKDYSIQESAPHARPIEAGCHGRQIGRKYDAQPQDRSIEIWLEASARLSPAFVAERRNIAAIMQATGWQRHSVRGFLAGVVRSRLKLNLISQKVDGARAYRIADGSGASTRASEPGRRAA